MEVPPREWTFLCNGGSYHAVQERGSKTRVMTPSGLWQRQDGLLMIGSCLFVPHPPPLPHICALWASINFSQILALDSLQGLVCGIRWGSSMAVLDKEVSFWTCFSVDWFGSLERIKVPFVLPKSTEPPMKGPDRETLRKIRFLSTAMTVHYLGLYCHLNILNFFLFTISVSSSFPAFC